MLPEDGQQVQVAVHQPSDLAQLDHWQGRSHRERRIADRVFASGTRVLHQLPSDPGGAESGDGKGGRLVTFGIPMIVGSIPSTRPHTGCNVPGPDKRYRDSPQGENPEVEVDEVESQAVGGPRKGCAGFLRPKLRKC